MNLDQNLRKKKGRKQKRVFFIANQISLIYYLFYLESLKRKMDFTSLPKRTTKTKRTEIKTLHFSELDSLVLFLTTEE